MSDIQKDSKKDVPNKTNYSSQDFNQGSSLFFDKYHSYLSKKIERLTSALYVITGFLSHDEPVRTRLRAAALDLVGQASVAHPFTPGGVQAFRAKVGEVVLLLRTAESAGLISRMNASLLCDEYAQAGTFIKDHGKDVNGSETFQDQVGLLKSGDDFEKDIFVQKDNVISKGHSKNSNKKGHDYRRKAILVLLDKKQKISIKDATDAIEGCSEKTIQRELLSLVEDGLVIKEGERRWSTYRKAPARPQVPQTAA